MKHRQIRWRYIAIIFAFLAPMLALLVPAQVAYAVGETYAWIPGGNIQMLGGNGFIGGQNTQFTGNFAQETPNRWRGVIILNAPPCRINADIIVQGDRKTGKLDNITRNSNDTGGDAVTGIGCTENLVNDLRANLDLTSVFTIGNVENAPAPNANKPLGDNPQPGGVVNPNDTINDLAKNQEECNDKGNGQIFDPANNKCRPPKDKAECDKFVPGSAFIEGKDGQPNQCDIDNDPCMIPKDGAAGSTALRWLACPLIEGANWLLLGCAAPVPNSSDNKNSECTGGLNGVITALLYTETSSIFGTQEQRPEAAAYNATSQAYYKSWGVFRTLGVGLVVIAGLIMIVSEAFGVGIVDAYTIRKLLPRLLVAAIAITLSWSLCAFLITLFNDLGSWARDLIQFPFNGLNAGNVTFATVAAQWFAIGGAGLYLAMMGPWAVLSMLGTVAIALLLGAAVLIIRQMLIILCVLVSPVAIAAFVLPNTQKLFSLWLNTFVRTLAMYPIIIGFLALGQVFSQIASTTPSTGASIIGIAAYIIPYFMIPYAFKLAGGAMATIGGAVGGAASGFFKARKEKHAGDLKGAHSRFLKGEGFKDKGFRKKLNNMGEFLGNSKEGLRLNKGFGRKGANGKRSFALHDKDRMETAIAGTRLVRANEHHAKDEHWAAIKSNDDYARAANADNEHEGYMKTKAHMIRKARQAYQENIDNGMTETEALAKQQEEIAAADGKARHAAHMVESMGGYTRTRRTASGWAIAETGTDALGGEAGIGVMDAAHVNAAAAGGNRVLARNLAAKTSGLHAAAGRDDIAIGAGPSMQMADKAIDGTLTLGEAKKVMMTQVSNRNAPGKITANKPMSMKAIATGYVEQAAEQLRAGDMAGYEQSVADLAGLRQAVAGGGGLSVKHLIKNDNEEKATYAMVLSDRQAAHKQAADALKNAQAKLLANNISGTEFQAISDAHKAAKASLDTLKRSRQTGEGNARAFGGGRNRDGASKEAESSELGG